MAIQQGLTNTFKTELLNGNMNFGSDSFKMALYTGLASIDATTDVYTSLNEVVGTGYTAGGETVTPQTVTYANNVAYINFNDVIWTNASFTARGALIYNTTDGNKTVAVLDFGADKTCSTTFTVTMPVNTSSTALIRLY